MRAIPLRRVGHRHNLVLGADRELVMFSGLLSFTLAYGAQRLDAVIAGILLWIGSLFALRLMARSDPQLRTVYLRHRRYATYYPAQATPFRDSPPGLWHAGR